TVGTPDSPRAGSTVARTIAHHHPESAATRCYCSTLSPALPPGLPRRPPGCAPWRLPVVSPALCPCRDRTWAPRPLAPEPPRPAYLLSPGGAATERTTFDAQDQRQAVPGTPDRHSCLHGRRLRRPLLPVAAHRPHAPVASAAGR